MDESFASLTNLLKTSALNLAREQGRRQTAVPGLALSRYDFPTSPERCLCSPMVAYVVQGHKRSFYGNKETNYGAGQCVVLGVHVPGIFQIISATPERPFLSLSLQLDNQVISRLFAETSGAPPAETQADSPLGVMDASYELVDAFRRLLNLLSHPEDIEILAPMIVREIHYRILSGPPGRQLRLFNTSGTKGWQIRRSVAWLRENYREELAIPDLAARANMAVSTFNRYFRHVTGLSPLQFQKRLRLHEAERLMLVENYDAGSAALAVGYGGVSQFSKEYKRLYGAPPGRDIMAKRSL